MYKSYLKLQKIKFSYMLIFFSFVSSVMEEGLTDTLEESLG